MIKLTHFIKVFFLERNRIKGIYKSIIKDLQYLLWVLLFFMGLQHHLLNFLVEVPVDKKTVLQFSAPLH